MFIVLLVCMAEEGETPLLLDLDPITFEAFLKQNIVIRQIPELTVGNITLGGKLHLDQSSIMREPDTEEEGAAGGGSGENPESPTPLQVPHELSQVY